MDRKEFCEILVQARKESKMKGKEIANKIGVTPSFLSLMENNYLNFKLDNCLKYLDAIDCYLEISSKTEVIKVTDGQQLAEIFLADRKKSGLSREALEELSKVSSGTIYQFERNLTEKSMDTFLKLAEALGFTVKVQRNKKEDTVQAVAPKLSRTEFCAMLVEARKKSGLKQIEICTRMQMLPSGIARIEQGKSSFNLKTCLNYLNAINNNLILSIKNKRVCIKTYEDLITTLIEVRKSMYTQKELAEKTNMSRVYITNIEKCKMTIGIDKFLVITNTLNIKIEILQS